MASPIEAALHRAALGLPYADALLTFASLGLDLGSENGRQVEGERRSRWGGAGWSPCTGNPDERQRHCPDWANLSVSNTRLKR